MDEPTDRAPTNQVTRLTKSCACKVLDAFSAWVKNAWCARNRVQPRIYWIYGGGREDLQSADFRNEVMDLRLRGFTGGKIPLIHINHICIHVKIYQRFNIVALNRGTSPSLSPLVVNSNSYIDLSDRPLKEGDRFVPPVSPQMLKSSRYASVTENRTSSRLCVAC